MKALVFAAGRGERLKPLTDHTPKPLVVVQGKPLIQHHIESLMQAGITELVINISWLKQQIIDFVEQLTQKPEFNKLNVTFSIEAEKPLETGGGMLKALPLLGDEPFIVVNADVYTDFNFTQLMDLNEKQLVNLVLVENPPHNASGDFAMRNGLLANKTDSSINYTYAGIGLYHPEILTKPLIKHQSNSVFSIVPSIKAAITNQQASAQLHAGMWHDVGTVERLNALNAD